MSFLGPQFLIGNIGLISLIIAGFILVVFDNIVTRNAFRLADSIRDNTAHTIKGLGHKSGVKRADFFGNYLADFAATGVILLYAYFGTTVLADYVFSPILFRLRDTILIWVIVVFLIMSSIVNNKSLRHMLMET